MGSVGRLAVAAGVVSEPWVPVVVVLVLLAVEVGLSAADRLVEVEGVSASVPTTRKSEDNHVSIPPHDCCCEPGCGSACDPAPSPVFVLVR